MSKIIYVLNGPNLNLLGEREVEIYGDKTLLDIEILCKKTANSFGFSVFFCQENSEEMLIRWIQSAQNKAKGIIINPAAYSHTSIAIADALRNFSGPKVEIHISNIYGRESFRKNSYISLCVDCVISGCGIIGYRFAIEFLLERLNNP